MKPKSILLISPPITKPCEPPAGIAKLAGALRAHGIDCRVYDASLDCLLGLLYQPLKAGDTWTRRALAHRQENLAALHTLDLYRNRDRYKRQSWTSTASCTWPASLTVLRPPLPTSLLNRFRRCAAQIWSEPPNNLNPTYFTRSFLNPWPLFFLSGNRKSSDFRSIS